MSAQDLWLLAVVVGWLVVCGLPLTACSLRPIPPIKGLWGVVWALCIVGEVVVVIFAVRAGSQL